MTKVKPQWKIDYEDCGQLAEDKKKAESFGHKPRGFGVAYGKTKTEEEWQEKLSTKFFLPIVEEERKEPKVKEAWKVKYEESGQHARDLDKAKSFGHPKRSFTNNYFRTNTEEEWQKKLNTKLFLPKAKKKKAEGWIANYKNSGQYAKDLKKAESFGHHKRSFAAACRQTIEEVAWQEKLKLIYFLPKIQKEKKVKGEWNVKYEESGQYQKDLDRARSFGHPKRSFVRNYNSTNTEEEWQKKLNTKLFLPKAKKKKATGWKDVYEKSGERDRDKAKARALGHRGRGTWGNLYGTAKSLEDWQHTLRTFLHKQSPTSFLETWDGSVSAFFAFIDDRIQINVDLPDDFKMTYSALLDFATQGLKELGISYKPLFEIAQSPEFVDKVNRREERTRSYEKEKVA